METPFRTSYTVPGLPGCFTPRADFFPGMLTKMFIDPLSAPVKELARLCARKPTAGPAGPAQQPEPFPTDDFLPAEVAAEEFLYRMEQERLASAQDYLRANPFPVAEEHSWQLMQLHRSLLAAAGLYDEDPDPSTFVTDYSERVTWLTGVCAGAYNSMGDAVHIFAIGVALGKLGYEIAERTGLPPGWAEECAMSLLVDFQLQLEHLAPGYRPSSSYVGYVRAQSVLREVVKGARFHISVFGPSYGPASPQGKAALYLAATQSSPGATNQLATTRGHSRRRRNPKVAGPGSGNGEAAARSEESAEDDAKAGTAAIWRPQRRRTCECSSTATVVGDLDASRTPSSPSTAKFGATRSRTPRRQAPGSNPPMRPR